jgi:hypothetical protein
MEQAMTAALQGPQKKKLKVFGHHFNVKPVEISREAARVTVNGHISHHLGWFRRDDQVYYLIVKEGDVIRKVERRIGRGGWAGLAAPIVAVVAAYFGTPVPPGDVEKVARAIGSAVDGKWEAACDAIIANVALRVT